MSFPAWVDLKGEDAVPETVHHVVVMVDPQKDKSWYNLRSHIPTDGVHHRDNIRPGNTTAGKLFFIIYINIFELFKWLSVLIGFFFLLRNSVRRSKNYERRVLYPCHQRTQNGSLYNFLSYKIRLR